MDRTEAAIHLKSKVLFVHEVKKKTSAKVFSTFKENTKFRITLPLVYTRGSASGNYALYFRVTNLDTLESAEFSQNVIYRILKENFKFGKNRNE